MLATYNQNSVMYPFISSNRIEVGMLATALLIWSNKIEAGTTVAKYRNDESSYHAHNNEYVCTVASQITSEKHGSAYLRHL